MGKKNFREVPDFILNKLKTLKDNLVEVCTIVNVHSDNIGVYKKFGFTISDGKLIIPESFILPKESNGLYSKYNIKGKTIVRKDLEKISKEMPYELKDWGGTWHYGTYPKMVYQREYWEPEFLKLCFKIIDESTPGTFRVKIGVEGILNKTSDNFMFELFFRCNLLQENSGSCDIFEANCDEREYIRTEYIDWEIFPPGEVDANKIYSQIPDNKRKPSMEEFKDRYDTIEKAKPIKFIQGRGQFRSYFGAEFPNGVIAFENTFLGNALYVIYEGWEKITQTPRSQLMRMSPNERKFERIVHNRFWKFEFERAIKKGD